MKQTSKTRKVTSTEEIARLADRGEDVSRFFTNSGRMMEPIRRVNVDFASPMLKELDRAAQELNISRQAAIKTLIRQALDQRYLARSARQVKAGKLKSWLRSGSAGPALRPCGSSSGASFGRAANKGIRISFARVRNLVPQTSWPRRQNHVAVEKPQGRTAGPALHFLTFPCDARVTPASHFMSATVKKSEQATDWTR